MFELIKDLSLRCNLGSITRSIYGLVVINMTCVKIYECLRGYEKNKGKSIKNIQTKLKMYNEFNDGLLNVNNYRNQLVRVLIQYRNCECGTYLPKTKQKYNRV